MTRPDRFAIPISFAVAASLLASFAAAPRARAADPAADRMLPLETREETLANGLRIVLVKGEAGSGGAVVVSFPAGEASLPSEKRGVATLAAAALAGGSADRPGAAFDAAVAQLGARLSARATLDAVEVAIEAAPESLAAAAILVAELLASPAFPESLLVAERVRLAEQLRAPPDTERLARAFLARLLLDRHPYAFGPKPERVEAITSNDLRAFQRRSMGAAGATLVIAGEFPDDEALLRAVRPVFARLPDGPARLRERVLIPPQTRRRAYLVHRAGETKAGVAIGNSGMKSGDPDLATGLLVAHALGDSALGRVPRALTSQLRVAARATVTLDAHRDAGLVIASALAEPAEVDSAVALLIETLEYARHEPLPAHEIEDAAASLAARHADATRTAIGLARETVEVLAAPRDPSWTRRFDSLLRSTSTLEIARVARRLVRPYTAPLVFAGDGAVLARRIARFGEILWFDENGEPMPRASIPVASVPKPDVTVEVKAESAAAVFVEADSAAAVSASPDSAFDTVPIGDAILADDAVPLERAIVAVDSTPAADATQSLEPPILSSSPTFDVSPFQGGETATYAVLFEEKEIARLEVKVSPDEWDERRVIAVHARVSGLVAQEISLAFRAEDFAPISCQLSRAGDSVATDAAFHYSDGRVKGRVGLPGGSGERAIDVELPVGTIDAGMIPYALRALPLGEGVTHAIPTFGPQTGAVAIAHIAAHEDAEVILPFESMMARRVEVTGGEAAGTYFVAETAGRPIVMYTTAITGLTFILQP